MTSSEFEKLILKQKEKLFRFALSILRNSDDAQDAVQEVVMKLWKNKRKLDHTRNLESYCLNAVKNHCFDVLRKQKQILNYEKTSNNDYIKEPDFEQVDMIEKIKQELYRLPTQQRMAIELKDFQDLDYEEISEILNQSVNAIRANVSRGRKKLYNFFKEELKDA